MSQKKKKLKTKPYILAKKKKKRKNYVRKQSNRFEKI